MSRVPWPALVHQATISPSSSATTAGIERQLITNSLLMKSQSLEKSGGAHRQKSEILRVFEGVTEVSWATRGIHPNSVRVDPGADEIIRVRNTQERASLWFNARLAVGSLGLGAAVAHIILRPGFSGIPK